VQAITTGPSEHPKLCKSLFLMSRTPTARELGDVLRERRALAQGRLSFVSRARSSGSPKVAQVLAEPPRRLHHRRVIRTAAPGRRWLRPEPAPGKRPCGWATN